MDNYPSNSRKSREEPDTEPKKLEKVIKGDAVIRKKPLGRRFIETFIGGDDARGVWGYVTHDVLVPAAKDMISDAVSQGFERMLYGDVRAKTGHRSSARSGGHVNYNRYSSPTTIRRDEPRREISRRARATHDFNEIVLATRAEAEEVLDNLFQILSQYEMVSVASLYELIGQTPMFTDEKYGWTDLRGSDAVRVKGGYLLNLPRPEPLD